MLLQVWEVEEGGTSIRILQEASRAELVQRAPAFLDGERTAVSVDVDVERCSPRYHETSLALESSRVLEKAAQVTLAVLNVGCAGSPSKISKYRVVSRCACRNSSHKS